MNAKKIIITFIRCGYTQSGAEKRFVGIVDEPLLPESRIELEQKRDSGLYPEVSRVYCSTQKRCIETSRIIYPETILITTPMLRAFNYGDYTGKTYEEILSDRRFAKASKQADPINYPNGESVYEFYARTTAAFQTILAEIERSSDDGKHVAIVSHKETILPIIRRYSVPRWKYENYNLNFGCSITVEYDTSNGVGKVLAFSCKNP